MYFSESKSLTSPQIFVGRRLESNLVTGPIPDLPSINAFQFSSIETPNGVTNPRPVTTTLGILSDNLATLL